MEPAAASDMDGQAEGRESGSERFKRPYNIRAHSCRFVVKDSQGLAKPISIGAPGFCVFMMTALSGCTSMSL
jgi:hypothetical protein